MLSVEVERIRSSSVWDETSFCWNKKTINEMIIILSKTSTFSYWTRTCHVSENLKNTFTMMSSDVDRICSSSVWEETSFCWKNKTGNKMIIILLKRSIFSYWTRTCHVSQNVKNTLTMMSSEDDRICSSSVWEEASFWLNKKTVNKIIIILLKRCIFSYWTITCHVSRVTELQKYLNDVVVRSWQNIHVVRLGRDCFLLKKKKTGNELIIILLKQVRFPIGRECVTCRIV